MPRSDFAAWAANPRSRLAIVGASGWVGRAFVDRAIASGLAAERVRLFSSEPREIKVARKTLSTERLAQARGLDDGGEWIVVHAAIAGAYRVSDGNLDEVRAHSDALLQQVFNLTGRVQARRLIITSSGAAHGAAAQSPAKAAYARLKRDQEEAAIMRAGCPTLLPRIFNLGGPYMTRPETYALGDFITRISRQGRVAINAPDPVFRNFVHVLEMAGVLLDMAVDETEAGEPFDIGGTEVIELGALAQRVARQLRTESLVIDRPPPAGGAGDWYVGDGQRYQRALFATGRQPVGLDEIIADTAAWLGASER